MSTYILEGYGFDCRIEEGALSTLFIDGENVLTSSSPKQLIGFMSWGKTGHPGWDEPGNRAVPPIEQWRKV
jgi:hypothetical protein